MRIDIRDSKYSTIYNEKMANRRHTWRSKKKTEMSHPTTYAVDFDGTLCENAYPEIGAPNLPLINTLISRRRLGARVILWTCREGELLTRAVEFCRCFGLEFDTVNDNTEELKKVYGTNPRKIGADYYIDDKAISPDIFVP